MSHLFLNFRVNFFKTFSFQLENKINMQAATSGLDLVIKINKLLFFQASSFPYKKLNKVFLMDTFYTYIKSENDTYSTSWANGFCSRHFAIRFFATGIKQRNYDIFSKSFDNFVK